MAAPHPYTRGAKRLFNTVLAVVLALGIISPLSAPSKSAFADDPPSTVSNTTDYVAAKFDGVGTNSVFDVVTYERLVRSVLKQDGKSIIVLGSPRNATSQATLAAINATAKQQGIQKIYLFDPHLGGELGYDGTDITNPTSPLGSLWTPKLLKSGAYTTPLKGFAAAATGVLPSAQLKHIDGDYSGDDTYLFVFDRKNGADSADTIVSDLLVEEADIAGIKANTASFKSEVADVLGSLGNTTETRFTQWDFFSNVYSSAASKVTDYAPAKDNFKLVAVTSPQLIHILKTQGAHNILVSGSWCGDSKQTVGLVSENASRTNSSPVYVWDFRINGANATLGNATADNNAALATPDPYTGTTITPGLTYLAGDTAGKPALAGWIGVDIINALGDGYKAADKNNSVRKAYVGGDASKDIVETKYSDGTPKYSFRSPYLVKIDVAADKKVNVLKTNLHELKDYEKPWAANILNDYGKGATAAQGDLIDYELNSGALTNAQKALGRASIGEFFAGTPAYASAPSSTVSTTVSKDDSGCGDDNDALDNVGGNKLIANHGTNDYDVQHYDIAIEYTPTASDLKKSIEGQTVVKATASKALKIISLDFRGQSINKSDVKVVVGGVEQNITNISRPQRIDEDLTKLDITLGSTLPAGTNFEVSVPYTTGILDNFVADGDAPQGFFKRNDDKGIAALGEPIGAPYWFVANDTPADGATYTITLKAPTAYTNISNGVRTSNTTASGIRTTVWDVKQDTAPYQIFASITNDVTELSASLNVSDGEGGSKTLSGLSYVNKTIYDTNANRARDKAGTFFNKLPYYIGELEKIAGPYPGEAAGFVFDNLGNGLGESATFGAIETKDRPFFSSTNITSENTFVHEYAHQWYGDAVRLAAWEDLWLNEGFATYVTDLFYENTKDFDSEAKYKRAWTGTSASKEWWQYAPAKIEKESDLFGGASAAYNKGALALATLRVTVGDDDFFEILKTWVPTHKGQAASTAGFIAFAEEVSDVNLTAWANDWLYGQVKPAAWPTYIEASVDDGGNQELSTNDVSAAKVASAKKVYTGKPITLTSLKVSIGTTQLVLGKDFVITGYKNNVGTGIATAIIAGKGDYKGTQSISFTIAPAKSKIVKAKAAKKALQVAWTKASNAAKVTSYELRYKVKGASKWSTKTVNATKASLKLAKLKTGKKYQVQVRVLKKVDKANIYSDWSNVKTSAKIK